MKCLFPFCMAAGLAAGAAHAADAFRVTVSAANAPAVQRSYTTAEEAINALRTADIRALVPAYTEFQPADFVIDYRGLRIVTAYVDTQPSLDFRIDALGIDLRFSGATREDSRLQFQDYLRSGEALGRILAYLARVSPVDPLAGNPASLQTRVVRGRFLRDFNALAREPAADTPADAPRTIGVALRPEIARHEGDGLRSVRLDLPFSYAFDTGPTRPLSLDGELQFTDTGGARTYGLQLGLAWRMPVREGWYLVPGASLGVSASPDLGGAGSVAALSATSALRLVDRPDMTLWLGNGFTWTTTLGTSIGDYSADPKLRNQVFTNGLVLSLLPGSLLREHWVELSFTDSRYRGSALYDTRYDELGVAWVKRQGTTTWRMELNYLDASRSRGWGARLHVAF